MSHQRLLEAENRLDTAMGKAFLAERVVLRGQDLHHDLADLDWFGLHLFAITGLLGRQLFEQAQAHEVAQRFFEG